MIRALINDIGQRVITFNKFEQKRSLFRWIRNMGLSSGSRVLDFGCGTGLFASLLENGGFKYWGYDIDEGLIAFASNFYKNCVFTVSKETLKKGAPFDMVLANCCFHHIDDELLHNELETIRGLLGSAGKFLMIDILRVEDDSSIIHKLFMKLERGKYVRTADEYEKIVGSHFSIVKKEVERSHLLSLKSSLNPIYNDLVVFACQTRKTLKEVAKS